MFKRRPRGLVNKGSNCYQNSFVQAIACCDSLVKELEDLKNKYEKENEFGEINSLMNLIELISSVNENVNDNANVSRKSAAIGGYSIFSNWRKSGQQDSFELMIYTINQAYSQYRSFLENKEMINKNDLNAWLDYSLPLRIPINYEIKCSCSDTVVQTPQQVELAIHVSMPKQYNKLTDLVDIYFEKDLIMGYECSSYNCNGKEATRQPRLFPKLPNTLCIHLQRNYWTGNKMKKISRKIKFDEELILKKEYMLDNVKNETVVDKEYVLKSVIVHTSGVFGGHYICYAKLDDQWYLTNDSSVSSVSWDKVRNCQPYILIYETKHYKKYNIQSDIAEDK